MAGVLADLDTLAVLAIALYYLSGVATGIASALFLAGQDKGSAASTASTADAPGGECPIPQRRNSVQLGPAASKAVKEPERQTSSPSTLVGRSQLSGSISLDSNTACVATKAAAPGEQWGRLPGQGSLQHNGGTAAALQTASLAELAELRSEVALIGRLSGTVADLQTDVSQLQQALQCQLSLQAPAGAAMQLEAVSSREARQADEDGLPESEGPGSRCARGQPKCGRLVADEDVLSVLIRQQVEAVCAQNLQVGQLATLLESKWEVALEQLTSALRDEVMTDMRKELASLVIQRQHTHDALLSLSKRLSVVEYFCEKAIPGASTAELPQPPSKQTGTRPSGEAGRKGTGSLDFDEQAPLQRKAVGFSPSPPKGRASGSNRPTLDRDADAVTNSRDLAGMESKGIDLKHRVGSSPIPARKASPSSNPVALKEQQGYGNLAGRPGSSDDKIKAFRASKQPALRTSSLDVMS